MHGANPPLCDAMEWSRQQLPMALLLLGALLFASGCGKAREEESWNSYYYGGYQETNGKFTYEDGGRDNDAQYVRPREEVNGPSTGAPAVNGTDKTLMDVRQMMQPSDGRNK